MGNLEFSYSWLYVHAHEHFSAALRVETVNTLEAMTLNQRNAAQLEKENAELQKQIIEAQEVLKQQEMERKNESEMVSIIDRNAQHCVYSKLPSLVSFYLMF